MRSGKPILIVFGAITALIGLAFLAAGLTLLIVHGTQRGADGFYTSPAYDLSTDGYAITSEEMQFRAGPGDWFPARGDLTLRVSVTPDAGDVPVFVGLADADDVDGYLDGVAHARVTRVGLGGDDVGYTVESGTAEPAAPQSQDFWDESTEAAGPEVRLEWDAEPGDWTLVIMNADAGRGVDVTVTGAVSSGILLPIGIGLLGVGLLVVGGAAVMLLAGAGTRQPGPVFVPTPVSAGRYPVVLEGQLDPQLSRGLWLVKWFLALPHVIVLAFLWSAFAVLTIVAGFAILFTGRYPRAIFEFNVGVMRWTWRVTYYAFGVLGTDRYPPFTLDAVDDYPATLDIAYPEQLSRGLVLVKWWLLAIPHYLIVGIFTGGIVSWTFDLGEPEGLEAVAGTGLIGVLVLVAAIVLLFAGRYPAALYDLVMGLQRWVYRVMAYATLMTDDYPPFRLDTGGGEPTSDGSRPPSSDVPGDGARELTRT